MGDKRKRSTNFSLAEKEILLELVQQQWSVIENKKTDAVSGKKKDFAWERIAANFNSQNETFRTLESLKNLWDNIKKNARKSHAENKVKIFKTGKSLFLSLIFCLVIVIIIL